MRGARLRRVCVGLEEVGRSRGVVRLRRVHAVDVVGVEGRLLEERDVELVSRAAGGREEREVALVQVGRQEVGLGLGVEGQVGVGSGTGGGGGLGEAGVGVEDGGVRGVGLGVGLGLLLLLLGAEEAVAACKGRVEAAVGGVVVVLLLVQAKT